MSVKYGADTPPHKSRLGLLGPTSGQSRACHAKHQHKAHRSKTAAGLDKFVGIEGAVDLYVCRPTLHPLGLEVLHLPPGLMEDDEGRAFGASAGNDRKERAKKARPSPIVGALGSPLLLVVVCRGAIRCVASPKSKHGATRCSTVELLRRKVMRDKSQASARRSLEPPVD